MSKICLVGSMPVGSLLTIAVCDLHRLSAVVMMIGLEPFCAP